VQDHGVADRDVGDPGADLVYPAGVLVAERVRQLGVHRLGPLALDDVQVGAAHPGPTDLDNDVERTLYGRLRHLVDHRPLVIPVDPDGLHDSSPSPLV
jgi:hypothetical protein